MSEYLAYHIGPLNLSDPDQKRELVQFLNENGLEFEETVEHTIVIRDSSTDRIIATGSFDKGVLKDICVDPSRRGEGLSDKIVSQLVIEGIMR
ncbi:MAG: [citrate (pro-3S)-lyase] ligase, partial [Candidatus Heimdallarchaeaceae archaeon]